MGLFFQETALRLGEGGGQRSLGRRSALSRERFALTEVNCDPEGHGVSVAPESRSSDRRGTAPALRTLARSHVERHASLKEVNALTWSGDNSVPLCND